MGPPSLERELGSPGGAGRVAGNELPGGRRQRGNFFECAPLGLAGSRFCPLGGQKFEGVAPLASRSKNFSPRGRDRRSAAA